MTSTLLMRPVDALAVALALSACAGAAPQDRRLAGQVIGGAAGAAVGSTIGSGSGRLVAIGAGAIIGAIAGGAVAE